MKSKIKKHQQILQEILRENAADFRPESGLEDQIIADTKHNHYQLVRSGWHNGRRLHNILFQFDLKPDGKIWIQANNTEIQLAKELMMHGVQSTDIVLGFHPPEYRIYTDYAVA